MQELDSSVTHGLIEELGKHRGRDQKLNVVCVVLCGACVVGVFSL